MGFEVWVVRRGIIKNKSALFHPTRQGEHRQERGNWGENGGNSGGKLKPTNITLGFNPPPHPEIDKYLLESLSN